jgi:hypothetical protein
MLALKQAMSLVSMKETTGFMPSDISNLEMWLKFNTDITADQDAAGDELDPVHATLTNTMETDDKINAWEDSTGKGYNAVQTTEADKPEWNRYSSAYSYVPYFSGTKYMDLDSAMSISANQDFSVVTEVMFTSVSQKAIYGSDSSNFFRINAADGFRCKIGGAGNNNFTEASDTIALNTYYTVIFTRENGATGDLRLYVNGGGYSDKAWGSTALTDADAFTINNIASAADDTNQLEGYLKNILIYKGRALTAANRKSLYEYLT